MSRVFGYFNAFVQFNKIEVKCVRSAPLAAPNRAAVCLFEPDSFNIIGLTNDLGLGKLKVIGKLEISNLYNTKKIYNLKKVRWHIGIQSQCKSMDAS